MMTYLKALVALLLSSIVREAPNVGRDDALKASFNSSIETMVGIHAKVSNGGLVSEDFDVLLLSAVNYRENRLKLPAPEGDCHYRHRLSDVPTAQWPLGYKPQMKRVCKAVGPMQINRGNARNIVEWEEVKWAFPDRDWSGPKNKYFSLAELEDPETNVRISYAILKHWKDECRQKDGSEAPVGVWLTAYRYGKCPPLSKGSGRYYIDEEAKLRCSIAAHLARFLSEDKDANYPEEERPRCTYKESRPAERSVALLGARHDSR